MALLYTIKETEDWYPLSVLFQESELEVKVGAAPPEGMVKMWRLEDRETGQLIAAATLELRDGVYTFGKLAVRLEHQKEGYGKLLHKLVLAEARKLGAEEVWGIAKVPDYYIRLGWEAMAWETAPRVAVCHRCDRRGTTCFPSILRIRLGSEGLGQ